MVIYLYILYRISAQLHIYYTVCLFIYCLLSWIYSFMKYPKSSREELQDEVERLQRENESEGRRLRELEEELETARSGKSKLEGLLEEQRQRSDDAHNRLHNTLLAYSHLHSFYFISFFVIQYCLWTGEQMFPPILVIPDPILVDRRWMTSSFFSLPWCRKMLLSSQS